MHQNVKHNISKKKLGHVKYTYLFFGRVTVSELSWLLKLWCSFDWNISCG